MTADSTQPKFFQPLYQASASGTVKASSFLLKGNGNTGAVEQNGDWRLIAPADDLLTQKRESGNWNTKDTITP